MYCGNRDGTRDCADHNGPDRIYHAVFKGPVNCDRDYIQFEIWLFRSNFPDLFLVLNRHLELLNYYQVGAGSPASPPWTHL